MMMMMMMRTPESGVFRSSTYETIGTIVVSLTDRFWVGIIHSYIPFHAQILTLTIKKA